MYAATGGPPQANKNKTLKIKHKHPNVRPRSNEIEFDVGGVGAVDPVVTKSSVADGAVAAVDPDIGAGVHLQPVRLKLRLRLRPRGRRLPPGWLWCRRPAVRK